MITKSDLKKKVVELKAASFKEDKAFIKTAMLREKIEALEIQLLKARADIYAAGEKRVSASAINHAKRLECNALLRQYADQEMPEADTATKSGFEYDVWEEISQSIKE